MSEYVANLVMNSGLESKSFTNFQHIKSPYMSDLVKNYTKWISDFTEEQFDAVVDVYIREIWGIKEFLNTDGTNDGGNDIRLFHEGEKLKVQVQVTIQENNLDGKVTKELQNAVNNVTQYGYANKLYFFYSHPVSEEKINELELTARLKYQIELRIIDAKKIASAGQFSEPVMYIIHKQYGLPDVQPKVLTEEDKMLYDFISFGSHTTEIKNQILQAYLVHRLYEVKNENKEALIEVCKKHFNTKDSVPFTKLIDKIKGSVIKEINQNGVKYYSLRDEEVQRINALKAQFLLQEQKLDSNVKEQLQKFNVSTQNALRVINALRTLFEANFNIDKQEILENALLIDEAEKVTSFNNFFKVIRGMTSSREKAKLLTKNLLTICKQNDILQKLSAGKLFASFSDPDAITNYINQVDRYVFCDTRIALYALCIYYEEIESDDTYYQSVRDFLNIRERYKGFNYKIYYRYINEIAYHLKEALLLIPFEEYDLLQGFNGTNNVFFNFYSYLKENQLLEDRINSLAEFLQEGFEVVENDAGKHNFFKTVESTIRERLIKMGIEPYDEDAPADMLNDARRVIKECQTSRNKLRPEITINNDAKMLCILVDDDTSVNEPVFITWDQNFFCSRKKLNDVYKGSRLWHYFTPNHFVSHVSILNFNIDANVISREVLTMFDETYNLYEKTQHLLDTLTKFLNVRTETGRKYVQQIKAFKKEYIYDVDKEVKVESLPEDKNIPIEKIIISLALHYSNSKDATYNLEGFKKLFTVDEIYDKVIAYFTKEIEHFKRSQAKSANSIDDMNVLINEALEIIKSKTSI